MSLSLKTVWIFRGQGQVFFESPDHYVSRVCIQDQIFNNFENDTMKVSVNEAKLTGLWARNCATIYLVLNSKFAFGLEKLPVLSRNGPQVLKWVWKMTFFWSEKGQDLENRAAHPHQEFPGVTPQSLSIGVLTLICTQNT